MRKTKRVTSSLVLTVVAATVLTGCVSMPEDGDPKVLHSFSPDASDSAISGPSDGDASDVVLRGFFAASAHPTRSHQAARMFLTNEAANKWEDANSAIIVDRLDINTVGKPDNDEISYQIRGNVVGFLGAGGTYSPQNSFYESTVQLKRVSGQWRVDGLPQGVVMERSAFADAYRPFSLYFLDQSGKRLVPDRRWVYARQESIGSSLLSLLAEGPRQELAAGAVSAFPKDSTIQLDTSGGGTNVEIKGLSQSSVADRTRVAAQIVWTLARADIRGPYHLSADGASLSEQPKNGWTTEDVFEFNPQSSVNKSVYAVLNGSLVTVSDAGYSPVRGSLGSVGQIESAAISATGDMAAGVQAFGEGDNRQSKLLVGNLNGLAEQVGEAKTMTRPSWSGDDNTFWVTYDGDRVQRAARSTVDGKISVSEVDMQSVESLINDDSKISELRIAPDGVRLAMIIGGHVYTAVAAANPDGGWRISNPTEVAFDIGDAAICVDWAPDGSLRVGTSSDSAPLWRVESDGSSVTQLSARNVQAPVVAVASNNDTMLVTDARAVLQMGVDSDDAEYWREVPGLQGLRAIPVLPR